MGGTVNHVDQVPDIGVRGEQMRAILTHAMGSPIEICDNRGPSGAGAAPHHHPWDEIFLVLEGEVDFTIGDTELQRLGPGSVARIPGGAMHSFRNVVDAHYVSITTQGRAVEMFQALDALGPEASATDFADTAASYGTVRVWGDHPHAPS